MLEANKQGVKMTSKEKELEVLIGYWRYPTPAEIKFGAGCIHYVGMTRKECFQYGRPKKWIIYNGLRYNLQ
jgi:hypothetical protein